MSASRRARLAFFLVLFACVMTAGGGWFWYRWKFPYGRSHACDKQLLFALRQYAEDQSGMFPAGEATPEASLSLLYPKYADAHVLSGKTVPPEVAQAILDQGERLGPKTCGWHYVEGLTTDDNPRLALVWDTTANDLPMEARPSSMSIGTKTFPERSGPTSSRSRKLFSSRRSRSASLVVQRLSENVM